MRHFISPLIVAFILTLTTSLQAGYVWLENASGDPNSTSNPPWTEDASVTGKLVNSGDSNVFKANSSTDISISCGITIQNATVSTEAEKFLRLKTGSSLTINDGGSLTVNYGMWMFGTSTAPVTLTINKGGSFSSGGTSSYLSDGVSCKAIIDVNGGYIENTGGVFYFGHHGQGEMTVRNSGSASYNNIVIGGGDKYTNSNLRGVLTIGTLNSTTDASYFKAGSMTIGRNSIGKVVLNSGTLEVTGGLTVSTLLGSTLESHGGTLNLKNVYFASVDVTADPNATVSYMNLENTTVNISENLFFGRLGKAEGTVTNCDFTVKYLHVGGENADAKLDTAGTGRGYLTLEDSTSTFTNDFCVYRGSVTFDNSTSTINNTVNIQNRTAGVLASLNVTNGSNVSGKALSLCGSTVAGSQDATLTVSSGATLTLTGANFSNSATGGTKTLIDDGTLTINGGATVATQAPAEFIAQNGATISVTGDFVIGASGTATMTIDNSSVTVDRYTQVGAGTKSSTEPTTLTLQNGATLNAKGGFWLCKSTSHPTALNVLSGSKLTFSADSYFGDKYQADNNTIVVDGGSVESTTNTLRIAWWGGSDTTVRNNGLIKSWDLLIGNQYFEPTSKSPTSGNATLVLESGGKVQATKTLLIGNANRKADVTFKAGVYGGFGSMEATTINIDGANLTIDASPIMFLTDYDASTGVSLVKATALSGWTTPTVTGTGWTVEASGTNVSLKRANSTSLGTLTVSGDPLTFDSAQTSGQLNFVNNSGEDFYLELNMTGLDTKADADLFVTELNNKLDGVTASALDANRIVLTNFAESFSNGVFFWDFTGINSNVAVSGASAYLPEPSTWALLLFGALLGMGYKPRGTRFQRVI